jgi:hypothetical protein
MSDTRHIVSGSETVGQYPGSSSTNMQHHADAPASHVKFEVGQKVEVIGETGIFLIVRIDRQRYCADLLRMGASARMELGIRLACLIPYCGGQSSSQLGLALRSMGAFKSGE